MPQETDGHHSTFVANGVRLFCKPREHPDCWIVRSVRMAVVELTPCDVRSLVTQIKKRLGILRADSRAAMNHHERSSAGLLSRVSIPDTVASWCRDHRLHCHLKTSSVLQNPARIQFTAHGRKMPPGTRKNTVYKKKTTAFFLAHKLPFDLRRTFKRYSSPHPRLAQLLQQSGLVEACFRPTTISTRARGNLIASGSFFGGAAGEETLGPPQLVIGNSTRLRPSLRRAVERD